MQSTKNAKRNLLVLASEREIFVQVSRIAGDRFETLTTHDARQALVWLQSKPIHILIADSREERFGNESFLATVRTIAPLARRLVLTTFNDFPKLIAGLHSGAIQNLITNPINRNELLNAIALPEHLATRRAS